MKQEIEHRIGYLAILSQWMKTVSFNEPGLNLQFCPKTKVIMFLMCIEKHLTDS